MRLTFNRLALAAFLLTALVLAARLAWVASTAETGWETVELSWQNAILGLVGLERVPIGDRAPTEQADIWLREVDRIVAEHPNDPAVAMGAAWILDSPGEGFEEHRGTSFFATSHSTEQESNQFERKCATRCLELAARATELDPENVAWWRLRALLLFRVGCDVDRDRLFARDANWLATLGECARHDSDNALYDCLAALQFWADNGNIAYHGYLLPPDVEVNSAEEFAKGVARFEQGRRKTSLALDKSAHPVAADFLRRTTLPRKEQADLAYERDFGIRVSQVLLDVRRWSEALAGTQERKGDWAAGLAILRQQQHINAMSASVSTSPTRRLLVTEVRKETLDELLRFASRHPDLIDDAERAAMNGELNALIVDEMVFDEALLRLERPGRLSPLLPEDTNSDAQLADASQTLMPWLLVFGVLGWSVARFLLRDGEPTRLGAIRHLLAWVVGWGAVFFMLGLCPAETLGRNIQTTILAGGSLMLGIVFLVLVFRLLAALCTRWARGPELWVVVALIGVLTFWQVIVAGVPSLVWDAAMSRPLTMPLAEWPLVAAILPAILLAAAVATIWALWLYKRRGRRPRRRHFAALGLMTMSVILVGGAFSLAPGWLSGRCWPSPRDPGMELYGSILAEVPMVPCALLDVAESDLPKIRWRLALWEWRGREGPFLSSLLTLLLVVGWYTARRRQAARRSPPDIQRPRRREWCGGQIHCLATSILGMAAGCLLVYLATTPSAIVDIERDYQHKATFLRDPEAFTAEVVKAEAAIRSDPAAMTQIRARAAITMSFIPSEPMTNEPPTASDP